MTYLTDRRQIRGFTLLFIVAYMVSYITRINFGAVISEMASATGISRSLLSMSLTGSFITYGAGQIVSGVAGDRISPKRLISLGFAVTVLMNLLIPFCKSPYAMLAVWCVNGFAQSFMWPPMVRMMTTLFSPDEYKRASAQIAYGSSCGTMLVYLLSPLLISLFDFRAVFFFSAACGALMLLLWNLFACHVERTPAPVRADADSAKHGIGLFSPLLLAVMLGIVLQGMLRDGVTTWMPSYIAETFRLSNAVSILTGVVLPIFSILCAQLTSRLYRKRFRNPLLCAALIFGMGAIAALALVLLHGKVAALSVFFSALLTGAMHGVNLMLICIIPSAFRSTGSVSTVSGVLNSCTYIGSAASTYGIARIAESFGWSAALLVYLLIAALGTAVCFACAGPWQRAHGGEED